MPENKRQHYVPQAYLRLFSRANDNRIGVYAIDRGKLIPNASIRGQACRDYFYGKDGRTERAFSSIEGHAARIFAKAVRDRQLPITGTLSLVSPQSACHQSRSAVSAGRVYRCSA